MGILVAIRQLNLKGVREAGVEDLLSREPRRNLNRLSKTTLAFHIAITPNQTLVYVLTPGRVQRVMDQVLHIVAQLHKNGIGHGRIRPDSFVLVETISGAVEMTGKETDGFYCEPMYTAPEMRLHGAGARSKAGDVWSLGCLFAELLCGFYLRCCRREWMAKVDQICSTNRLEADAEYNNIVRRMIVPEKWVPDILAGDLLVRMLQPNPADRITLKEALESQYCMTFAECASAVQL